jgi:tetratricopeptide (TPR) repeat protein
MGGDMAQGDPLDDLIGGGEAEALEEARAGAAGDAVAAAVAMDAARYDPELARKAGAYLARQARFVDIQAQDLIDQRALQTSHLKLRRFTEQLKAATQVFIVLIAAVAGLGLLVMLSDAFTSRSVVVDAFEAPPALAARGLSGAVVASGVLDQLEKLQAATRSPSMTLRATSAWASDIKVQAPGTGVSIGEIDRLLHARFGHDVHIDGDLVQAETGALALTVRGDGVPAQTFQGQAGELGKLTTQAAEYIYGRSQPYQFANYLVSNGRDPDALAFLPTAYAHAANDDERFKLAVIWGNAYYGLNEAAPAVEKLRLALALKPGDWLAWGNLVAVLQNAQGEEAAWREGQAMLRAIAKAPKDKRPGPRLLGAVANVSLDMPLSLAGSLEDAAQNGGAGTSVSIAGPQIADDYGLMHDQASAARWMAASDPQDWTTKAEALILAGYGALDRGDYAGAVAPLEAFWTAWRADPSLRRGFQDFPCFLGLADGMTGRVDEAETVFKRIGPWSRCFAMHGDVLEHAGDLAGAERVWAQGIAVGPDLSPVYLHRGISELNRGDLARAGDDLAAASARSPHWADPLKAWGDLLAREGRWKKAVAKYDAALKYAPAWAALRQARAAAAAHKA